jgi:hypothetical protein
VDVSNQALNSFHESEQMNRSRDKRNLISCCGGACKQAIGSDIFGEQQHVASGEVFSNPGRQMNPLNQLLIRILRTPAFSGKRTKYTYCDHKLEQVVDLKDASLLIKFTVVHITGGGFPSLPEYLLPRYS